VTANLIIRDRTSVTAAVWKITFQT